MGQINSYITMVNANHQCDRAIKIRSLTEGFSPNQHASETTMERICSWLADEVVMEWLNDQTVWTNLLDFGEDKMQLQCVSFTYSISTLEHNINGTRLGSILFKDLLKCNVEVKAKNLRFLRMQVDSSRYLAQIERILDNNKNVYIGPLQLELG